MITKADLNKRICDVEPGATNTETYREFIFSASQEIWGISFDFLDFEHMSDEEINDLIEELDYLLEK